MVELAWGLRMSNSYFLWVVTYQGSGRGKAPKKLRGGDVGEGNSVSLVSSAGGLNSRVGGMLYDPCGLNSTLEALTCSFPIVAVPKWTDQPTNAQYIMDFWKMRLKAPIDKKGLVSREAAEHCIREIMEGERGKEIKKNAIKLRKLAKEARVEVLIRTLKNL